jgi:hypothetical protein
MNDMVMESCSLVGGYQRFGEHCCLNLQGGCNRFFETHWKPPIKLQGVI